MALKVVHASVHSVASAVAIVEAHSANDSFSQRSFHHFMVTRSPNHMCASSCRIVTTRRSRTASVTFTESYVFRSKVTDAIKERRVVTILHGANLVDVVNQLVRFAEHSHRTHAGEHRVGAFLAGDGAIGKQVVCELVRLVGLIHMGEHAGADGREQWAILKRARRDSPERAQEQRKRALQDKALAVALDKFGETILLAAGAGDFDGVGDAAIALGGNDEGVVIGCELLGRIVGVPVYEECAQERVEAKGASGERLVEEVMFGEPAGRAAPGGGADKGRGGSRLNFGRKGETAKYGLQVHRHCLPHLGGEVALPCGLL